MKTHYKRLEQTSHNLFIKNKISKDKNRRLEYEKNYYCIDIIGYDFQYICA